eukprot:8232578-Karenia_brevis.AAC.1
MQHKLEGLTVLDMQVSFDETIKAMSSSGTAMLVQKEFEVIRNAHLTGAATEFQIQTMWRSSSTWHSNTNRWGLMPWKHQTKSKGFCRGWGMR